MFGDPFLRTKPMLRQVLILAGGRGTRLGALTDTVPKPMLDVGGRPFLEYLLWNLRRFGLDNIVLSTGYRAEAIESHFGDGREWGVAVACSREARPLGTGGGVRQALPLLDEAFFVLNGDTLFDCNYLDLALLLEGGARAALALRQVGDASRYGSVACDGVRVVRFGEKFQSGPGLISAGVYALTRQAAALLPPGESSIEQFLFPALAARGELAAKAYPGFFLDIGLPETLAQAGRVLPAWRRKPGVFFDCAVLLPGDAGSSPRPEGDPFAPGAVEAVKWCNDGGYLVMAVDSRPGQGERAGFSPWMREALRRRGAHLDAVYRAREASGGGGPVRQALEEWGMAAAASLLVAGDAAGLAGAASCGVSGRVFAGGSLLDCVREGLAPS